MGRWNNLWSHTEVLALPLSWINSSSLEFSWDVRAVLSHFTPSSLKDRSLPNSDLRSEWGGKGCENIRQWVPEYLVLLPGLSGSAPGELTTKGKVSKGRVGNTANNPALWWPLHGSKWHRAQSWVALAPGLSTASWCGVLTSRNNFRALCSIFQARGLRQKQKERRAHGARPGQPQERRWQWLEHSGRANFAGCLAWWLFIYLFTILKDYSPFHQCFFEMTGSAIH